MNSQNRIIVNTIAQHIRNVFNICLSLYSTRLVLQALGHSDFGIYSLVAGVVAMLSFLTNAMVVTTQRHLSFIHGTGNMESAKRMFANSLFMHIVIGLCMAILLSAIAPLLFNGFLVIEETRKDTAYVVYFLMIFSLLVTFCTAPFRALFIARENIVYLSIVDILDAVIKLLAAIWLLGCSFDRLVAYACIIVGIMLFNFIALFVWARIHFEECVFFPRKKDLSKQSLKEITNFAGWTVYSQVCVMGRTQGMAILLNRFFGTTINAAYGIAQQVFGAIYFVAASVGNAVSPQLIAAEGKGDRKKMLRFAELLSKYAFLLLAVVTIPVLWEMPVILSLWLGDVPAYAVLMCRMVLLAALTDQLTTGLSTANQATGKVKHYSLLINTQKVLTLPLAWIWLKLGGRVEGVMWCYFAVEFFCSLSRVPFMKYSVGLSIREYSVHVFARVAAPLVSSVTVCGLVVFLIDIPFRFLLTGFLSLVAFMVTLWFWGMDADERSMVLGILRVNK